MSEDNQSESKVGTIIGVVLLTCVLAIIVALTVKVIQWLF